MTILTFKEFVNKSSIKEEDPSSAQSTTQTSNVENPDAAPLFKVRRKEKKNDNKNNN